ncbi:MAG: di-heme oxidoredictase family protein [Deltaproteobacteria bacterium]|nr:di-heme oxidoredictase family protein [Deltaproteobacteria bacterium]
MRTRRVLVLALLISAGLGSLAARGLLDPFGIVASLHAPGGEHLDQEELVDLLHDGRNADAFSEAFEHGDELFETSFNAVDGVGAEVGDGSRVTRVPRADLAAWSSHTPSRATGPNAAACTGCHNLPGDDGAGSAAANVHRDPTHSGELDRFIQRNTPHVFAPGALQRLAEEMTEELQAQRDAARAATCRDGRRRTVALRAKQLPFGALTVTPRSQRPCRVDLDLRGVRGVDQDLVVRPFQWKGSVAFLRDFNRGAAHNELGMQPVELTGDGVDGDGDGVADEMTIGDMTALAVYLAAQPRPTSKLELDGLGLLDPPLSPAQRDSIRRGEQAFQRASCTGCHRAELRLADPIFREPSANPNFRDATFPGGQDPVARGVDPALPVRVDLTADQPDNVVRDANGQTVRLGALVRDGAGGAIVSLYGDLRRHDMGPGLAEAIDETGSGASVFLTENLWGVGSTAPYLHDGRATTLSEAILLHGGEAQASRRAFEQLSGAEQSDLIAFLDNLVLFKVPEE